MLEKSVPKVIKSKDSDSKWEENIQHECGEKGDLVETCKRKKFTNCTPSMIKCISGINQHVERIKCINMSTKKVSYPLCGKIEDCNLFYFCENNSNERE